MAAKTEVVLSEETVLPSAEEILYVQGAANLLIEPEVTLEKISAHFATRKGELEDKYTIQGMRAPQRKERRICVEVMAAIDQPEVVLEDFASAIEAAQKEKQPRAKKQRRKRLRWL